MGIAAHENPSLASADAHPEDIAAAHGTMAQKEWRVLPWSLLKEDIQDEVRPCPCFIYF